MKYLKIHIGDKILRMSEKPSRRVKHSLPSFSNRAGVMRSLSLSPTGALEMIVRSSTLWVLATFDKTSEWLTLLPSDPSMSSLISL
jgi:hypothetical protein